MKIQQIKNSPSVSFKSYNRYTERIIGNNKSDYCISQSHLMRNFDTASFAADYTVKTFPNGTNIAIEGCSQLGAYTYGILFHPSNQNKQYKITGCDIVPEVIEDAKLGVLNLGISTKEVESKKEKGKKIWIYSRDPHESFLFDYYKSLTPEQKIAKASFEQCIEHTPADWKHFNVEHPNYKRHIAKRLAQPGDDIELMTKRLEYMHKEGRRSMSAGIDFIPKDGVFDDVLSFNVDDILNIDKQFRPNSVGMVSCENMLYHILGSRLEGEKDANGKSNLGELYNLIDTTPAKTLFEKINLVLQENGLIVLGTLGEDHLVSPDSVEHRCVEATRKGEKLYICESPIHNLLFKLGFEPIHYGFESMFKTDYNKLLGVYLPSVWKKIRHI